MRVDMLAIALAFVGVAFVVRSERQPAWLALAMPAFVLSIYTRQTELAAPASALLVLLLVRPRATILAGIGGAVLGLCALAWLEWATAGGFLRQGTGSQLVSELSGGNQQKVVIAKNILREPKVVILDEPTRGIDVGARAAIYDIIADLARRGMAVIIVSSDLDEVLGLSHRVMVLSRGRNRGVLGREKAGRVAVMELATT